MLYSTKDKTTIWKQYMKPGINNIDFKIQLNSNWIKKNDILSETLLVLENPKRKWYKLLFQILTLGIYKAPWEYKVKKYESKKD